MRLRLSKPIILIILLIALFGIGVPVIVSIRKDSSEPPKAEPAVKPVVLPIKHNVIGTSVQGRAIDSYTYGYGDKHIAFVGGMHGGYEWNSVLLAYQFMDYLDANPQAIPKNLTVTVIPAANPDGVYKVTGKVGRFAIADVSTDKDILASGRFNANNVDLNRNFACKWQPESMWQGKKVSAGSSVFSEPEARAIRDFVLADKTAGVVFWHSQANTVYAGGCGDVILPATLDIMNAYAHASGYNAAATFDAYEITGASEGWLTTINIPALTVELQTHESVEWERNLAGIKAIFQYYGR